MGMLTRHATAEEILMLQDGELTGLQGMLVRRHVKSCAECTAREHAVAGTSEAFAALHGWSFEALPDASASRALLKARLMTEPARRPATVTSAGTSARWALGSAALLIAGLCGAGLYQHERDQHERGLAAAISAVSYVDMQEPDHALTPGAVRQVALADICSADEGGEDDQDPIVTPTLQETVFHEYGMGHAPAHRYQVDYLISPQLGGTNSIQNLWPQPYASKVWNAQAKDALEGRLHEMVCAQQIDLASAQHDIATDWISAYQRVFHTVEPR